MEARRGALVPPAVVEGMLAPLRDDLGRYFRRLPAMAAAAAGKVPGEAAAVLDILRPSLVVGGQPDWNAPNSLPADFVPEGVSDEPVTNPVARYWKAMTSGGSTGRPKVILDHQPAVTDPAVAPPLLMEPGAALLNPGPLYHNAPFIVSHFALFGGGSVTGMAKFDAEETFRLIDRYKLEWVNFVPTMMHRIWSLPEGVTDVGEFDAADLGQYLDTQDSWELKIARTSSIPVHWLTQTGTPPSGESLKTTESAYVSKVKKQQQAFGESWRQVMRLSLIQAGADPSDAGTIAPIWAPSTF